MRPKQHLKKMDGIFFVFDFGLCHQCFSIILHLERLSFFSLSNVGYINVFACQYKYLRDSSQPVSQKKVLIETKMLKQMLEYVTHQIYTTLPDCFVRSGVEVLMTKQNL